MFCFCDGALLKYLYKMAASLKDKRMPITTPPYQVLSADVTPDPPTFSLDTTFKDQPTTPPTHTNDVELFLSFLFGQDEGRNPVKKWRCMQVTFKPLNFFTKDSNLFVKYSRVCRRKYEKRGVRQYWSVLLLFGKRFFILVIRRVLGWISAPAPRKVTL
jgi:hypothetical protein